VFFAFLSRQTEPLTLSRPPSWAGESEGSRSKHVAGPKRLRA
jgi:hypothetical protein